MNDRESLELAAKAAGIEWDEFTLDCWNPLISDGDALQLAVNLGVCVTPYPIFVKPKHSVIAKIYESHLDLERGLSTAIEIIELYKDDQYAATRRAIVRAAAEIGKLK